jgi:hypothetical protein
MRTRRWPGILAFASFLFLLAVGGAFSAQGPDSSPGAPTATPISVNISPSADAWVDALWPTGNYGSDTVLRVGSEECPGVEFPTRGRTLIRFSLSSIPAGQTIESATLYLYQRGALGASTNSISIRRATSSWSESTVT